MQLDKVARESEREKRRNGDLPYQRCMFVVGIRCSPHQRSVTLYISSTFAFQ